MGQAHCFPSRENMGAKNAPRRILVNGPRSNVDRVRQEKGVLFSDGCSRKENKIRSHSGRDVDHIIEVGTGVVPTHDDVDESTSEEMLVIEELRSKGQLSY